MFNIFFQKNFVIWGKVVVGYILLKANILSPISLANDVPTHPQKKKKVLSFGLWCV